MGQGFSTRRRVVLALVAAVAVLTGGWGAAPALADDASVLRAWEGNDAQFAVLGRQVRAGATTLERTRRPGPLLGALVRTRALIIKTRKAVLAERASSPAGASARLAALRSLSYFERSIRSLWAGTVAAVRGERTRANTLLNRSEAELKQADSLADLATSLFRQAGLSPR